MEKLESASKTGENTEKWKKHAKTGNWIQARKHVKMEIEKLEKARRQRRLEKCPIVFENSKNKLNCNNYTLNIVHFFQKIKKNTKMANNGSEMQ